ncbi:hypothetical protein [Roseobacter sp. MH60115]|uniref:hypothetical protein n=1 Tax=Roseobacter sp. MH60115 TaxID=2785324 RepID=UPI0018A2FB5E|nr:hypothetical protein [Roseobacter sp. MH60115]
MTADRAAACNQPSQCLCEYAQTYQEAGHHIQKVADSAFPNGAYSVKNLSFSVVFDIFAYKHHGF